MSSQVGRILHELSTLLLAVLLTTTELTGCVRGSFTEYTPAPPSSRSADLLLLLWPIFFVTAARPDPHLRVRNFKKSAARGSERVASVSETLCMPLSLRRRREAQTARETGEKRPAWECADAPFHEQV